jgi:GTP cyclohydrolase I
MMMRGAEKQNSKTVTPALLREFRNSPALRSEFLWAGRVQAAH